MSTDRTPAPLVPPTDPASATPHTPAAPIVHSTGPGALYFSSLAVMPAPNGSDENPVLFGLTFDGKIYRRWWNDDAGRFEWWRLPALDVLNAVQPCEGEDCEAQEARYSRRHQAFLCDDCRGGEESQG